MSDRIEAEILDVLGEEVAAAVDTPLVVIEGPKGDPGADGITPTIGDNGNWYLGAEDTGKPSRGETGPQGTPGIYYGTTPPTGDTHPVWIDPDGGPDDGGLLPAVTAADNGKVLRVVNSAWSAEDMPTDGTDMGITGATVGQIAKIASVDASGVPTAWSPADMPGKLPNPNALTFTGAVTGSYDGSAPLSVEIPSGGGSISLPLLYDLTTSEEVGWIDTGDNAFLAKNLLFVELTSIATTTNESDKDGSASMYPLKPNAPHAPWSNEAVAKNVSALMAKTYTKVFRAFSFRGDGGYWTSITSIRNFVNTAPVTPSMVLSQIEGVTDQPIRGLIIGNAFASSKNVFGVGSRLRVWGV